MAEKKRIKEWPPLVTEKLANLPAAPGCYIYRNEAGEILYVGKAISLKSRVRSYFQPSANHSNRIARLVTKIRDIETMTVDNELEALVLECTLIKQHRPPYNVRLRDDKSYPYILITKEKFPRVLFTRRTRKDGGKYFGPYTSTWAVRDTLDLLHKSFTLIPCGKSWSGKDEQRPCLYYHIGQCLAPCAGLAKSEEYAEVVNKVERFLQGKSDELMVELREEMEQAAEDLDFEKAAKVRDRLGSIEQILSRQKVISNDDANRDVVAVVKDERGAAVQMLYIRQGKLIGQRHFIMDGSAESSPGEAVTEFVKQYYAEAIDVPREILLPVEIEEKAIVQQWLRSKRGSAVTIEVPGGGDKLKLIEMAAMNAEQALNTYRKEIDSKEAWVEEASTQLQNVLKLPTPPLRVEGYDISNIQGISPVGSMVVTENGAPNVAEYRRFKIKYHPESPNDFAMMHEVITRRLKAYIDGDKSFLRLPDLIMIDGGKGQLAAALKARDQLGLMVPMIGLAKRMELIIVPHQSTSREEVLVELSRDAQYVYEGVSDRYDYSEIELPISSAGLMLLRRLRDEAHRFALTFHRKLRTKRMTGSALDEIPGVGPRRRRMLLRSFGSIEGIRRATIEEVSAVPTMTETLAKRILNFLNEE